MPAMLQKGDFVEVARHLLGRHHGHDLYCNFLRQGLALPQKVAFVDLHTEHSTEASFAAALLDLEQLLGVPQKQLPVKRVGLVQRHGQRVQVGGQPVSKHALRPEDALGPALIHESQQGAHDVDVAIHVLLRDPHAPHAFLHIVRQVPVAIHDDKRALLHLPRLGNPHRGGYRVGRLLTAPDALFAIQLDHLLALLHLQLVELLLRRLYAVALLLMLGVFRCLWHFLLLDLLARICVFFGLELLQEISLVRHGLG
mmetsp:Transcript_7677/g.19377  ORF Transcript_7677/g.19377 Transcript_7677/m.19377 type:complete len:255 (+) Transcript_7677:725-1489(+)